MTTSSTAGFVTIRPALDADAEAFHRCLDLVARERRWLAMTTAPPLEASAAYRRMLRAAGGVDLVAIAAAGEVVGWADVERVPWEGMRHVGRLGMGLLPAYRGRGLGRRLLTSALEAAARAGLVRIELEVYASNKPAIALYRAAGFREEGRKVGARELDGRTDDLLIMAKCIQPAISPAAT